MVNYTPTDDVADVHDKISHPTICKHCGRTTKHPYCYLYREVGCQTPLAPEGKLCGQKAVHFDGYPCCQECYDNMKGGPA